MIISVQLRYENDPARSPSFLAVQAQVVYDTYRAWLDENVKKWDPCRFNMYFNYPRTIYLYDEKDALAFSLRFPDVHRA